MRGMIVDIMVEVVSFLAVRAKELEQNKGEQVSGPRE